MSLNHVSDQDIVECLQDCPELDGPLFDVNVLDELCFSDELWTNLDLSVNLPTQSVCGVQVEDSSSDGGKEATVYENITGHSNHGLHMTQMVYEEVPGMVTPPYSPPTPCSSSGVSSMTSPASTTPSIATISPSTTPSKTLPSQDPTSSAPAPTPFLQQQHSSICSSLHPEKVSTGPQQPPSTTACKQKPRAVQNLSPLYSQISLPHFNGSLQVLKSGETVCIPQMHSVHLNRPQPSPNKSQQVACPSQPPKPVKQEPVVVGQKRQHPDTATTTSQVDMSNLSKKQQRMIKNRESACISRQKKRQYIDSLEDRLKEAAFKNSTLLQENNSLRKQVTTLEKENEMLRVVQSNPSSPSSSGLPSPLKKPTLVMIVVLCFSISALYCNRDILHYSRSSLSSITALTHVKSRALLSIETESKYAGVGAPSSLDSPVSSKALVPLSTGSTTVASELEERIKKWKMHMGKSAELPSAQQIPRSCSCPLGGTSIRNNLTSIRLINEEMTSCFKLDSLHNSNEARQNSLTVLNHVHHAEQQNYLVDGPRKLYEDFRKFVPRDLNNYYLLSFKEHVLLHPSRKNSSHFPLLSIFIPADADFKSLLQMDCEVTSTKIISHVHR